MGYAWRWRLVGSADREVAGSHAPVTHVGPASGCRLETLHTSGRCMRGSWKSGGSWQRSAGTATQWWRSRPGALSERAPGAVGLSGRHCSTGPGPILCTVLFCNYSNFAQISKYKVKTIPMSKIIETLHGSRFDHSKQCLPLGPLPILNIIQVIKLGTTPL
jgi:hypothetical protein